MYSELPCRTVSSPGSYPARVGLPEAGFRAENQYPEVTGLHAEPSANLLGAQFLQKYSAQQVTVAVIEFCQRRLHVAAALFVDQCRVRVVLRGVRALVEVALGRFVFVLAASEFESYVIANAADIRAQLPGVRNFVFFARGPQHAAKSLLPDVFH